MEARSRQSLASIEGVSAELAETLFKEGWRSAAEIAGAKPDELAAVGGIGDAAKSIIAAASKAAEAERVRYAAEEAARAAAEAEAAAAAPPSPEGAPRGTEAR
jgi:ERCC4-type nuclease